MKNTIPFMLLFSVLIVAAPLSIGFVHSWVEEYTGNLVVLVNVKNKDSSDIDRLSVSVYIPELTYGVYSRSTALWSIASGDTHTRYVSVPLPENAEPGFYWAKVTVGNGRDRAVDYVPLYI